MNTSTLISGLFVSDIGVPLFRALTRIHPEGQRGSDGHSFHALLPTHDPRTIQLLRVLSDAGFKPWQSDRPDERSQRYTFELRRIYEPVDLEGLEFVELCPSAYGGGEYRDEKTGFVKLDVHNLDNSLDFLAARNERYVLPERVKRIVESAAMRHVVFRPALLCDSSQRVEGSDKVIPWDNWGPPWWEISSDYTLPQVSPALDVRDFNGKPVERGNPHIRYLRKEGFYLHPELRYRRQELEGTEPFDLARTFECFGGEPRWNERTLVASKRFYQFCIDRGLKAGWVPVRIDE